MLLENNMKKIFLLFFLIMFKISFANDFQRDDIFKICFNEKNEQECQKVLEFLKQKDFNGCIENNAQACFELGEIKFIHPEYLNQKFNFNLEIDESGLDDIEKSCNLKYAQACLLLGLTYSKMAKISNDKAQKKQLTKKSKNFFRKSCELDGDELSCYKKSPFVDD